MKKTVFAERQYESTFLSELGRDGAGPFQPTQRLERFLGIDAATNTHNAHRIWRILDANIPQRMPLSPGVWPRLPRRYHSAISGRVVSLFFQFKVAKYQDGAKARYRPDFGQPYYEVALTKHQQSTLLRLQQRVRARALVRYAAPVFWSQADFDKHAAARRVVAQSAFLRPTQAGSHRKWMYAAPTGKIRLNPDPEEADAESWEALTAALVEQSREESIREHVHALAASMRDGLEEVALQAEAPWITAIRQYVSLSDENLRYLADLRTVVNEAERADTTWLILVNPGPELRRLLDALEDHWEPYLWDFWM